MSDYPRNYPRIQVRAKEWDPERCKEIGYGGEAAVYKIDSTLVAKIFHLPDSSTYETDADRKSAVERHRDMQAKLFALPEGLPEEVVVPTHLIENNSGRIIGYAMPFKDGMTLEAYAKTTSMLSDGRILRLLGKLYDTIMALHQKGVVVGDLNESNVLVCGGTPYLIDVDSMQFGGFRSRAFTPRFTDPHLLEVQQTWVSKSLLAWPAEVIGRILWVICRVTPPLRHRSFVWRLRLWGAKKPHSENIVLKHPHTELSDWYSFMVIAMRLFTYTDPYGGVHKKATLGMRLSKTITVFDPDVVYPASARPLSSVPRDILETFFKMFSVGKRFVPDRSLFGTDAPGTSVSITPSIPKGVPNHG